ncbi:hypothetical protein DNFV4_02618 [Nitrospira tepida]|uniref:Uncharacterized protein n=1 Tax=Nitrospira tepida TaxID=2973512 RepID=A0AA86T4Z4_9BACT|nr:hypothetical protein [Nitrospira tepida]CAI4032190.1 hypothetical protein DNFV4_02618 [Nitrospira tepida]
MPNTNASFSPLTRSDQLKAQLDKLEGLDHRAPVHPNFQAFDAETEDLLVRLYGQGHRYVEAYKYATVAEAEAIVNLPASAQEPMAKDLPKTALQQRRQVLLGILTEVQALEAREATVLTGEDREDPPSV